MSKRNKQKIANNLPREEKRERYRKALSLREKFSREKVSEKRILSLDVQSESKSKFLSFFQGMANVLVMSPPGKIQIPVRTVQDRVRRSWLRTGVALQLAMDEYDRIDEEENEQFSKRELLQAADS